MKILLVPYDGPDGPSREDIKKADLVLKEEESGDFVALKWRDGDPADVLVKVSM